MNPPGRPSNILVLTSVLGWLVCLGIACLPRPSVAASLDLLPDYEVLWESIDHDSFPQLDGWVTVIDKGSVTTDLPLGAFRLLEDGVAQPSLSVIPESEGLDVVLVVDTSGSMREALARSVAAVRFFIKNLGPKDRVALVGFSDLPRVLQPLTSDTRAVDKSLDRLKPDGGTALYDTLVTSAGHLKPAMRRRVIVLLTDGQDQNAMGTGPGSRQTLDQAVESCRKAHAAVFGIGLGFQVDKKVLGRVTEETGGQAYWATGADQLQALYLRIMHDIQRRYHVTYRTTHPEEDGSERRVRLLLDNGSREGEGDTVYWVSRKRSPLTASRTQAIPVLESGPTDTPTPTATMTSTATKVPPSPTSTPTVTRVPPTSTSTSTPTATPLPSPVPARLSLDWDGRQLGIESLGQLVVFVEGDVVAARNCQIVSLPDRLPPAAVFYLDRRAFLSPGRYRVRAQAGGRLYEAETSVQAGLLDKIALSPARNNP